MPDLCDPLVEFTTNKNNANLYILFRGIIARFSILSNHLRSNIQSDSMESVRVCRIHVKKSVGNRKTGCGKGFEVAKSDPSNNMGRVNRSNIDVRKL